MELEMWYERFRFSPTWEKRFFWMMLFCLPALTLIIVKTERPSEVVFVESVDAREVFEMVANISNHFQLENHLISINFTEPESLVGQELLERGHVQNKDFDEVFKSNIRSGRDWGYSVDYVEYFTHLPAIFTNQNHGIYKFTSIDAEKKVISSKHETDYIFGLKIVADNVQIFKDSFSGTKVVETLTYECPVALLFFCFIEVEAQRPKIMKRIKKWKYHPHLLNSDDQSFETLED